MAKEKKKQDSKGEPKGDYRQAVEEGDYDEAYRILADYRKEYRIALGGNWRWDSEKREIKVAEGLYYEAFDYIYNAEILQILAKMDGGEALDKIVFLLAEVPVEGVKLPQGLCEWADVHYCSEGVNPLGAYARWVQHYNGLCNNILILAINRKNKNLARQILMHFVDNVETTEGGRDKKVNGEVVDANHGYINYTKTDYNDACKKYEDAVKLGLFD